MEGLPVMLGVPLRGSSTPAPPFLLSLLLWHRREQFCFIVATLPWCTAVPQTLKSWKPPTMGWHLWSCEPRQPFPFLCWWAGCLSYFAGVMESKIFETKVSLIYQACLELVILLLWAPEYLEHRQMQCLNRTNIAIKMIRDGVRGNSTLMSSKTQTYFVFAFKYIEKNFINSSHRFLPPFWLFLSNL